MLGSDAHISLCIYIEAISMVKRYLAACTNRIYTQDRWCNTVGESSQIVILRVLDKERT